MDEKGKKEEHEKLLEFHKRIVELEKLELEREAKNNELLAIKRKIHKLFDDDEVGIAILQDAIIKYANPKLSKLIGYSPEELINQTFILFVHHDEIAKVVKNYIDRMAGKEVPAIYRIKILHKNGSIIQVEIRASEIRYQGRPADFVLIKEVES